MRSLLCCMLICISAVATYACDVCGASTGGQSLGLLPQFSKHFVGVQYLHRYFSSVHTPLLENKDVSYSDEYYNTTQLWGRYALGRRLQLFAFVPYQYNTRYLSGTTTHMSGVGDITLLANANIVRTADTAKGKLRHMLQAGVGVKMPTGSYKGVSQPEREGLPNMQPGSGSWDIPVNVNYTVRYSKVGANIDAAYTITTANKDNYKYGNRLNTQLSAFYSLNVGRVVMMPQLGVRYEYALHDYDNYDRKWLNEQTGGSITYTMAGMQAYFGNVGLQAAYYQPVAQQYADGNVTANKRMDAGFVYLFK